MAGCDMNRLVAATFCSSSSFSLSFVRLCVSLQYEQALDSLQSRPMHGHTQAACSSSLPQAFLDREAADLEDGYQGALHATGPSLG
ncbi:hypothetical protein J3F84DRAFT_339891 [Trichoderma pleuroticola]